VTGLGLGGFDEGRDPAALALEWGVRRLDEKLELRTRAGQMKAVTADFFPAYDDDGGLLVALTPRTL
jgi:predicted secreted protein